MADGRSRRHPRERQPGHGPGVSVQNRDVLSTRRLPYADGAVGARRSDPSPVRAVHSRGDVAGVAVVRRLDLPARADGPLASVPSDEVDTRRVLSGLNETPRTLSRAPDTWRQETRLQHPRCSPSRPHGPSSRAYRPG